MRARILQEAFEVGKLLCKAWLAEGVVADGSADTQAALWPCRTCDRSPAEASSEGRRCLEGLLSELSFSGPGMEMTGVENC